jgi:hypothetical protein
MQIFGFSITEITQIIVVFFSFIMIVISFCSVLKSSKAIKNQNRAYITFNIELTKKNVLSIIVQNTGHRLAEKVKIETDPKLKSNLVSEKDLSDKLYYESIPPSFKFESVFDYTFEKGDVPLKYKVFVSYKDKFDKYKEEYMIDFSMFKNSLYTTFSYEEEDRIKNVVKALEDINKNLGIIQDELSIKKHPHRIRKINRYYQ